MHRLLLLMILLLAVWRCTSNLSSLEVQNSEEAEEEVYLGPDTTDIPDTPEGELIRYGLDLVKRTAYYIGPNGVNGKYLGNKMNCVNCHLDAGTRPYGLNYFSSHGNYPQYRPRENAVLTLEQRVNNCVERPHNGRPLPLDSKEMIAIVSYIKFLGQGIPNGEKVKGSGGIDIEYPKRAADPVKGKVIYAQECARCHMDDGQGKWLGDKSSYEYPPLWGMNAYQPGSSMYRIIKAAQFIKANMPFDKARWDAPVLSDEEAFDVAAYINNLEHIRPNSGGEDYEDIRKKYIDYPYGPYDDPFSENQHRYGPFQEIIDYRKKHGLYLK